MATVWMCLASRFEVSARLRHSGLVRSMRGGCRARMSLNVHSTKQVLDAKEKHQFVCTFRSRFFHLFFLVLLIAPHWIMGLMNGVRRKRNSKKRPKYMQSLASSTLDCLFWWNLFVRRRIVSEKHSFLFVFNWTEYQKHTYVAYPIERLVRPPAPFLCLLPGIEMYCCMHRDRFAELLAD